MRTARHRWHLLCLCWTSLTLVGLSVTCAPQRSQADPPALTELKTCGRLDPLKWDSWLFEADRESPLFTQEDFTPESEWRSAEDDVTGGWLITDCFGEPTPHSARMVLHAYPPAPLTPRWPRPVLLITGAGDHALRSMSFMAVALSRAGFQSYALTFAHRHGDNFQQAELIAQTLRWIQDRHQVGKVDAVAYSKGVMSLRIYASNHAGADWSEVHPRYAEHGTSYEGALGRVFFLGGPLAGLDTPFRWPSSNLFALQDPPLDAPSSWTDYYPTTTANLLNVRSLEERSIYQLDRAPYTGQAQMLSDLTNLHALPGGNLALGPYANQLDYYTTYEGGLGFYSHSYGIQRAIEDGGDVIATLQSTGVAPDIELYLGAGGNPIMSVGGLNQVFYESYWGSLDAAERRQTWEALASDWIEATFPWATTAWSYDLPRLLAGSAFLGELSGPSDGLVFTDSALEASGVTASGAQVLEARLFEALNHAELVAAGQLAADFYGDQELAGPLFDDALAQKYLDPENQAVEWVIETLRGPVPEGGRDDGGAEAGAESGAESGFNAGEEAGSGAGGGAIEAGERVGGALPDAGEVAGGVEPTLPPEQPRAGSTPAEMYTTSSGERFGGSGCEQGGSSPLAPLTLLVYMTLSYLRSRRFSVERV